MSRKPPASNADETEPVTTASEQPVDDPPAAQEPGTDISAERAEDERYLRLAADFENFRRRKAQELADRSRYAAEEAARALLPVLDNLRRAVEHAPEAEPGADFINGIELVVREFEAALGRLGVTPIEALGEPFDPALHEALGGEEADDVTVDTVAAELQRGYRLHDRVLRPALVRVAHPRRVETTS